MVIAARILGDQVGSSAPVFLAILAVHVIAGLAAVITGAIAALTRKGSPRHIIAGRWFYRAITTVFATAAILAAMRWSHDYYLLIIGAVAFSAATTGYLHRSRHRPGDAGHIAGMGIAYTAMLTAFYVDNGPHLPLWDRLPTLAFWLLPSAIAAPVIARALIRAKNHSRQDRPPDPALLAQAESATGDRPAELREQSLTDHQGGPGAGLARRVRGGPAVGGPGPSRSPWPPPISTRASRPAASTVPRLRRQLAAPPAFSIVWSSLK